jgi:hypothetical protein
LKEDKIDRKVGWKEDTSQEENGSEKARQEDKAIHFQKVHLLKIRKKYRPFQVLRKYLGKSTFHLERRDQKRRMKDLKRRQLVNSNKCKRVQKRKKKK